MTIHQKAFEQHFAVKLFFPQLVILENLSIFDFALSGVEELIFE